MEQNLYEKYGGFSVVSGIVHEFYRRVEETPLLAPYFKNSNMEQLINHQIRFFSTLMGGPVSYDVQQIDDLHRRLNISSEAFAEILTVLDEVLEDQGVVPADAEIIMDKLRAYRPQIVAV
jgi:hemoglobin